MLKKVLLGLMVPASIAGMSTLQAAENNCMPIGGLGTANLVAEKDGTYTIAAKMVGSVSNAAGKVTKIRKTATGLELDMEHYFMTAKGGFMLTRDIGVLTAVPGKKDHYMTEITYKIQEGSTSGVLKGYKGTFKSWGLTDLGKPQVVVRYAGEICK